MYTAEPQQLCLKRNEPVGWIGRCYCCCSVMTMFGRFVVSSCPLAALQKKQRHNLTACGSITAVLCRRYYSNPMPPRAHFCNFTTNTEFRVFRVLIAGCGGFVVGFFRYCRIKSDSPVAPHLFSVYRYPYDSLGTCSTVFRGVQLVCCEVGPITSLLTEAIAGSPRQLSVIRCIMGEFEFKRLWLTAAGVEPNSQNKSDSRSSY